MPSLGQVVQALRVAQGMSQTELARKSGLYASYISRLEADEHSVSVPKLQKIATVLGTRASKILRYVEKGYTKDAVSAPRGGFVGARVGSCD